ncbi:MAG: COG2426 family protein [Enterococcus lemanii]|jgi:uncharacterized membrane protein
MLEMMMAFFEQYLTSKMVVFFISLMPVLELRGGLVAASILGLPWYEAMPIAIIGNLIPVPFIIFFIEKILTFLAEKGPIKKLANKMITKGRDGGQKMMEKYPERLMLGLFLFVAIPLPGTGAWTGSLIAALLGLPPKKSFFPIAFGVLTASVIMLLLAYSIPGAFGLK